MRTYLPVCAGIVWGIGLGYWAFLIGALACAAFSLLPDPPTGAERQK